MVSWQIVMARILANEFGESVQLSMFVTAIYFAHIMFRLAHTTAATVPT